MNKVIRAPVLVALVLIILSPSLILVNAGEGLAKGKQSIPPFLQGLLSIGCRINPKNGGTFFEGSDGPSFVCNGWGQPDWSTIPVEDKQFFLKSYVELYVDGEKVDLTLYQHHLSNLGDTFYDMKLRWFYVVFEPGTFEPGEYEFTLVMYYPDGAIDSYSCNVIYS